MRSYNRSNT